MAKTISATDARIHLGEVMRCAVEQNLTYVVERGGAPLVVIVSVDEFRRLGGRVDDPEEWEDQLTRTRELIRRERGDEPLPDPAEIIRASWEERDEAILAGLL